MSILAYIWSVLSDYLWKDRKQPIDVCRKCGGMLFENPLWDLHKKDCHYYHDEGSEYND